MPERFVLAGLTAAALILPAAAAQAETEPNDQIPQAELFTAAPATATGTMGTPNDVDRYAFYVGTPATQVHITLDSTITKSCGDYSGCAYQIILEEADGDDIRSDDDSKYASDADPRIALTVDYSIAKPGTYYIAVSSVGRSTKDAYTLKLDANQPLASYKPEVCETARAELASRRTALGTAQANAQAAAANAAAIASKRPVYLKRVAKTKRKLLKTRKRYKRRIAKRAYKSALQAASRNLAALNKATTAAQTAAAGVPFQQQRVAEQEGATRASCGGSL